MSIAKLVAVPALVGAFSLLPATAPAAAAPDPGETDPDCVRICIEWGPVGICVSYGCDGGGPLQPE